MRIACYARKSNHKETDSIENQLSIMREYIGTQPDLSECEIIEFADSGCSGIDMEREAFQELLALVRQRQIDVIIVKDLSRLGRNYLDISKLVDSIFPFMKVRLIAISDNYDSNQCRRSALDLNVAVKSILNEYYVEESSEKIHQSSKARIRQGEFIGSFVPYGYERKDRYTMVIVPEEAAVVREIFQRYLDGQSSVQIAWDLNLREIPTKKNRKWSPCTILKLLKNEEYTGKKTAIQARRDFKTKALIPYPKEEWYINEEAFPPIIDRKTFAKVQERFCATCSTQDRTAKHIMSRKLICAGCGRTLNRNSGFRCRNGYITGELPCFEGSIRPDFLFNLVLEQVKRYLEPELQRQRSLSDMQEIVKEISGLKEEKAQLFEKLYRNELTQEAFSTLNVAVTAKIRNAESRLTESRRNAALKSKYGFAERPIDTFKRLYEADELTGEHMQFVKLIKVYDTEHFDILMQDESPLSVLCRNQRIYEED